MNQKLDTAQGDLMMDDMGAFFERHFEYCAQAKRLASWDEVRPTSMQQAPFLPALHALNARDTRPPERTPPATRS